MTEFYDPDARPANITVPLRKGLQFLQQPSRWSCLPASFAMVMGLKVQDVLDYLKRDDERGFHIQELLGLSVEMGFAFVPFVFGPDVQRVECQDCHHGKIARPVGIYGDPAEFECETCDGTGLMSNAPLVLLPMEGLLRVHDGVLIGKRKGATHDHAAAWCRESQQVLDPEQGIYGLDGFEPEEFWAALRVQ